MPSSLNVTGDLHEPDSTISFTRYFFFRAETVSTEGFAEEHAFAHACSNALVSSVYPSPVAPKLSTFRLVPSGNGFSKSLRAANLRCTCRGFWNAYVSWTFPFPLAPPSHVLAVFARSSRQGKFAVYGYRPGMTPCPSPIRSYVLPSDGLL